MWLGVSPRIMNQKDMYSKKKVEVRAENMLPILQSTINMVEGIYTTTYDHENLHFDNE